jgi:cation:H+ antiporter
VDPSSHPILRSPGEGFGHTGEPTQAATSGVIFQQIGLVVIGLVLLALGSNWLVQGAVGLARAWGVSELIIGLTPVAAGTSLPEAATSILAAIRGQRDIAVGNIVGSNPFNILGILGIAGLVPKMPISVSPAAPRFDIPVMTAVAIPCLTVFFTGKGIARWEGELFLAYCIAYTAWLTLNALGAGAARTLGLAVLVFVPPWTCITRVVSVLHTSRGTAKYCSRGVKGEGIVQLPTPAVVSSRTKYWTDTQ